MYYAKAARAAVEANREYSARVLKTCEVRYLLDIDDPREIEWAEEREMGAYLNREFTRFLLTNTPDELDVESWEEYSGPRFFAPVTSFVADSDHLE